MKAGINLEAGGSRICSLYLKSSGENGPVALNTESTDESMLKGDEEVFVTCHKEVDCGDKKIAIIGLSDGTLKLFDVSFPDIEKEAPLESSFSTKLCEDEINEIKDVKIHEYKNRSQNGNAKLRYKTGLKIEDNGSFDWYLEDDWGSVWGWEESDVVTEIEKDDVDVESLTNYPQINISSNDQVKKFIDMAILLSTSTTSKEEVETPSNSDNARYVRPKVQHISLFLRGIIVEKDKYKTEEKNPTMFGAAMQMRKKMASGHDMYLSMKSIIAWSRLKEVVRYIDIPMSKEATEEDGLEYPIIQASFFMSKQPQRHEVSTKSIKIKCLNGETKYNIFNCKYNGDLNVVTILNNGRICVLPKPIIKDGISDRMAILSNETMATSNHQKIKTSCTKCDGWNSDSIATWAQYPLNDTCFVTYINNPQCCSYLSFWEYQEEDKNLSRNFIITDLIEDPNYWPYQNDSERRFPIIVYMTIVHLLKKTYAVLAISPDGKSSNGLPQKSSLFVTEIPTPDTSLSSIKTCFDNFNTKPTRKLYANGKLEIFDIIFEVKSCPPHFQEYFACRHMSQGVSIWTVKGAQLRWIPSQSNFSGVLPMPCFVSRKHESMATYSLSYVWQSKDMRHWIIDIIDVFEGRKDYIQLILNGHSGHNIGHIYYLPLENDSTKHSFSNVSPSFSPNKMIEKNPIKRKWSNALKKNTITTESQFVSDKKIRLGGLVESRKNENGIASFAVQKNCFPLTNVMNIFNEKLVSNSVDPDKNIYSSVLSTLSLEEGTVKMWAFDEPQVSAPDLQENHEGSDKGTSCNESFPSSVGRCPIHKKNNSNLVDVDGSNMRKTKISSITSISYHSKHKQLKYNQQDLSSLEVKGQHKEKIIGELVFILNENGRLSVSKFLQQHESSKTHPQKNAELFNLYNNHWEFAKQQRNAQGGEGEEKNQTRRRTKMAKAQQYCLECSCSYTAMNNETEKMRLLMLLGKEYKEAKKDKEKINSSSNVGSKCPKNDKSKQGCPTADEENQNKYKNSESLNLDNLLVMNEKKKKMLQTLREEGLGKMTSLSAVHISSFNGSTFCPFNIRERNDEENQVNSEEGILFQDDTENFSNNISKPQQNSTSSDDDENKSKSLSSWTKNSEKAASKLKRSRKRPATKKLPSEGVKKTQIRDNRNDRASKDVESISRTDNQVAIHGNNNQLTPKINKVDICIAQSVETSNLGSKELPLSMDHRKSHRYTFNGSTTIQENTNKSKNDQVENKQVDKNDSFDIDGSGHDDSSNPFVIFITTSIPPMHPNIPSFIIWSYDIMMDDVDGEKRRQKCCYDDDRLVFENEQSTQKIEECMFVSKITPIDVVPYGNMYSHDNNKGTIRWDNLSKVYHEFREKPPLALCSDIKIVQKSRKHYTNMMSLNEVHVWVILGLENGDILEYNFDMVLIQGVTYPIWTITSDLQKDTVCRKFCYSKCDRILSLHYQGPNEYLIFGNLQTKEQRTNENFVVCTSSEEMFLQSNFEDSIMNTQNIHPKLLQLLSVDNCVLSPTIRSYKLENSNKKGSKLIIHGSKDGSIYIYEACPLTQKVSNLSQSSESLQFRVKKVGQYFCGKFNGSEIISCVFVQDLGSVLSDDAATAHTWNDTVATSQVDILSGMETIGYIIAGNKNGRLFLLKILKFL